MKKLLKKIIPKKLLYKIKLMKLNKNSKKSDLEIKKYISNNYYKVHGKKLDWNNPKSYTEKMNISKYLYSNELKTNLTDKYLVRDWIKDKIGENYLVPLLGVYDKFEDIDFSKLPDKFVIKCNHDSGSVTIVNDKKNINYKDLSIKYNYFLKRNLANEQFEMHYLNIKPKILIEKYMGKAINDYKFLCFDGKPYYVWVDFDRFSNHKRNIYNMNWELQKWNQMNYGNYDKEVLPPKKFEEMKGIVSKLCKGFDHVRVDLYEIDGNIYFGEMTFTNGSGLERINPEEYDLKLGSLWNLNGKDN